MMISFLESFLLKLLISYFPSFPQLHFDDGETHKVIDIPLSEKPQDCDVTNIDVTLLTPVSEDGVTLGENTTTKVAIVNDIGKLLTAIIPLTKLE